MGRNNPYGGKKGRRKAKQAKRAANRAARAARRAAAAPRPAPAAPRAAAPAPRSAPAARSRPSSRGGSSLGIKYNQNRNKSSNKNKNNNKKKNNPYGGKKGSRKINPKKYQTKAQKQDYIRDIISDGKITGSEARNAASLGISRDRIQKGYDKSFRPGNPFSTARMENGKPLFSISSGPKGPAGKYPQRKEQPTPYTPLIIGNKAASMFAPAPAMQAAPQPPAPPPAPPLSTGPEPVYDIPDEPLYNPFEEFFGALPDILDSLQPTEPMPYEPLPVPVTYASIGQAAQSAPGVKARRSSASQSMASSLGTRGAFNRGGLRISNLNI